MFGLKKAFSILLSLQIIWVSLKRFQLYYFKKFKFIKNKIRKCFYSFFLLKKSDLHNFIQKRKKNVFQLEFLLKKYIFIIVFNLIKKITFIYNFKKRILYFQKNFSFF